MRRLLFAALLLIFCPPALVAQVGGTTDILIGVVTGPDQRPVAGATVEATSLETQVTRHALTNAKGRYTILFPDGGGQYRVVVRYLGMAPQAFLIARAADEDRLVRDVQLSATAQRLAEVRVVARRPRGNGNRPAPGGTERAIGGDQATRLPVDASDPMALAALAPGVVPIGATDSTSAAFSVAGMRPTANNVTLDGLTFGGASIPQDAVRSTRVITSTYDVSRGQFSGGLVATTTKGGTNNPSGAFTYNLRDRSLAWGAGSQSAFGAGATQNQLSGGAGGPIIRDKLFIFGAAQGRWRSDDVQSLLSADPATLRRLGASPDSVRRFLTLVGDEGIPALEDTLDPTRATNAASALVRLDYIISDAHTLMLRGDWRLSTQDPTRTSAYALPTSGGTMDDRGGGIMAVLSSHFGASVINELRAYASTERRRTTSFMDLPVGRVQLASSIADSGRAVSVLAFGGNASLPNSSDTKMLEASDELSWLPGDASHRFKLGALLDARRATQDATTNQYGTFLYNSLTDFENGTPASFTRTLAPAERDVTALDPAVYLGDTWRKSRALQLTYGVRLEGSVYSGAPAFNASVDSAFGLRTDRFPSELHLSPRAGFTWTVGDVGNGFGGGSGTIIRGGVGEFRSATPVQLFTAAEGANGLANTESQLVCVGSAVPTPDWSAYAADPSTIPTSCVAGASSAPVTALPSVTVFDPSFEASRAWRASLGAQKRLFDRFGVSVDASVARGVALSGVRDVNLGAPSFTLGDEGGRPVYVPASTIVPQTGAVDFTQSRRVPGLGQVLELTSDLASRNAQLTVGVNGFGVGGLTFQASYTYARSRDQSSYAGGSAVQGFAAATTGGDPNLREWATSDFERRHSFLLTATYGFSQSFELTTIARLMSGAPFTPLVGSDINGDGARNDRAFIFSPAAAPDSAIANGMSRLLARAPSSVRDCLGAQLGEIAARNSCTGPWQPGLDLQANWRPTMLGLARRLTISLTTVNFLAGLDQWLHGSNGLHGWGELTRPDPTLLYVRGFDPSTQRYLYSVNERFGATGGSAAAFRVPFQIAVQARLTLGEDQAGDRLRGMFGAGRRGAGRPSGEAGASTADLAARFARALPNPVAAILDRKDSLALALTDDQVARLTALRDTLDATTATIADSIRDQIQRAGPNPDPARLFASIRPRVQQARTAAQKALDAAHKLLTADQWAKLPDDLKTVGFRRRRPE